MYGSTGFAFGSSTQFISRFRLFFSLSKIFWLAFQPLSVIFLLILIAVVLIWFNQRKSGLVALGSACLILFIGAYTTTGSLLLIPLEERFPKQPLLSDRVNGIILLGGYLNGDINAGRPGFELNSAADRLFETIRLARLYPDAKIIVSGGDGGFFERSIPDAQSTQEIISEFGLAEKRFIFENESRNTAENAIFSQRLADPQQGEIWLLVTSAYHMPRAVGSFRRAGFDVVAWPVDYKTPAVEKFALYLSSPNDALSRFTVAMREWVGLLAYWMTSKTDMFFPQP